MDRERGISSVSVETADDVGDSDGGTLAEMVCGKIRGLFTKVGVDVIMK
jgi:hypothetical protein